jgi:hypothetical protein
MNKPLDPLSPSEEQQPTPLVALGILLMVVGLGLLGEAVLRLLALAR